MEGKSIIIKKVKKRAHGGHHGGSWKVAYADFVTAMMAFFLLLWLISMVSPEKRARVAHYFKYFSLFDKGGSSMLDANKQSPPSIVDEERPESTQPAPPPEPVEPKDPEEQEAARQYQQMVDTLRQEIETRLADVKDQIMLVNFEGGVRIEMVDKEGASMFPRGSAELTPPAREVIKVITENVRTGDSKIAVEGHTDAMGFASGKYSNWELSTERASAARREMEKNGLAVDQLVRVSGYADTRPLIENDPYDPKNRRISILLFRTYSPFQVAPASVAPPAPTIPGPPAQSAHHKIDINTIDAVKNYLSGK